MINSEKKKELSFSTEIFMFFSSFIGFYFLDQLIGMIHDFVLIISIFSFSYAVITTINKMRSNDIFFNLHSKLGITYFIFISLLFSMILSSIVFLSKNILPFCLLLILIGLQLLFIYRLLMFYDKRLNYISNKLYKGINKKIKKEVNKLLDR